MLPNKRNHPQWRRSCWCSPATFTCSRALANWWGTCKRSTGVVPATTSSLNTAVCVVRHFCSWSVCVSMPSASTMSWLTGQAATTRTIAITWPTSPHTIHLVPVYALMAAVFSYMSPSSAAASRVHYKHVVSFCQTALSPLFCSGFSRAELCFDRQSVKRTLAVFSSGLPLLCRSSSYKSIFIVRSSNIMINRV